MSYSDEVVRRFANLTPAAPDFRLYWDNAYSIHHLYDDEEDQDTVLEILGECRKAGHPDIVYKFISTSKVTFPGSGLAALATSRKNLSDIKQYMMVQTIGHDKLNQLRHVRFFGNIANMREHMKLHAAIMRPKFELVEATLDREIGELEIGTWTKPRGGYASDRGRRYIPVWNRSARPQYQDRAVLPDGEGTSQSDGSVHRQRKACQRE